MGRAAAGGSRSCPPFLVISNIFSLAGELTQLPTPPELYWAAHAVFSFPHLGAVGEEEYRRVGTAPGGN